MFYGSLDKIYCFIKSAKVLQNLVVYNFETVECSGVNQKQKYAKANQMQVAVTLDVTTETEQSIM